MAQTSTALPGYRRDIDGLRAIAVLAVVAFHAFPNWIQGGYIGVDVFFVISGFLITGIVLKGLESGDFSFTDFYRRRIRRIFPALLLILTSCLVIGWFVLLPDEYKQLGKHIAGGSAFMSNFILLMESSYFDSAAESKQLLHLWSLAVEEQFYVVWPLLLWIAFKRKWNFLAVSALAAGVSFYLNIQQAGIDGSADFYCPQTRFWELICGSALACAARPQGRGGEKRVLAGTMSMTGLLLLACGFCLFDKDVGFPGKWALIPVLGAMLVIYAGPNAWANRIVLGNRALVWIGLISFPLYLWHWPILSFLRTMLAETPSIKLRAAAVLLSVILAWLTYRLVEHPVRFGQFGKRKTALLAALVGVAGVVGLNVYLYDGFSNRAKERDEFVAYFDGMAEWIPGNGVTEAYRHACNFLDLDKFRAGFSDVARDAISSECYVKDPQAKRVVMLWGDSHAQQLYFGLSRHLSHDWQILQVATSGCDVNFQPGADKRKTVLCEKSNRLARAAIAQARPDVVLISQKNPLAADVAVKFDKQLHEMGVKQVIFVGPVPRWQVDLSKLVARKLFLYTPRSTFTGLDMAMYQNNSELRKKYSDANINYADVMALMCQENGCLTYLGDDVRKGLTTRDYGHLLPVASDFIAKNLLVPRIYQAGS